MLVIRPATYGDAEHYVRPLLEALVREQVARFPDAYPRPEPFATAALWVDTWRRRLEAGDESVRVWLAADRAPLGMVAGEVWTRPVGKPSNVFFGEWLYVVPEERHRGVGLELQRAMVDFCQRAGLSHIECRALAGDPQWQARGWRVTSAEYTRPVDEYAADLARATTGRAVA